METSTLRNNETKLRAEKVAKRSFMLRSSHVGNTSRSRPNDRYRHSMSLRERNIMITNVMLERRYAVWCDVMRWWCGVGYRSINAFPTRGWINERHQDATRATSASSHTSCQFYDIASCWRMSLLYISRWKTLRFGLVGSQPYLEGGGSSSPSVLPQ